MWIIEGKSLEINNYYCVKQHNVISLAFKFKDQSKNYYSSMFKISEGIYNKDGNFIKGSFYVLNNLQFESISKQEYEYLLSKSI